MVSWSRFGAADCVRVGGGPAPDAVEVRVAGAAPGLPPMAGRVERDGEDRCFVPRFPFVAGTAYAVVVDGAVVATLVAVAPAPALERSATTGVVAIHPTAAEVPRNLLRLLVVFSARMAEGEAAGRVRLVDDDGRELTDALLPTEHELWDAGRRRLTVLLDPARIKRGLVSHRALGYPLEVGGAVRLVVDGGFRDATGTPIGAATERRWTVGADERRHVDPAAWTVAAPPAASREPLSVAFDRPLDHALLGSCLQVIGPSGDPLDGVATVGPEQRSWGFAPRAAWSSGTQHLVVDPALEDLAGNSVTRVFDRDLARPEDDPRPALPVARPFRPR